MSHSLDAIFRPKSVAIIGASSHKGAIGREIFDKMLNYDFSGPVYPVNPKADYIHSVKAYASISQIPGPVDLAIVVVRKELVLGVVQECAQHGVKGLVVITAGFKETGEQGARLERQIAEIVKSNNMRMVGPNCMGVINTEADVHLDATFAPTYTLPGRVALVSQSGALGQTILEHAYELNLGVSMFVSVGNKADVSGNDLLEYWRDEPAVGVILMYLESFGNPQRFIQLAKEVSHKKPIVVVKSGRSTSGARAATSHTGALAGMDLAFDALFRQCGIIRADSINEMFEVAMGLAHCPLPKGNRVAIITNAGGPGIMAADACEGSGLDVIELSEGTQEKLKKGLVPDASFKNPVDLLAGAQPEEFQFALTHVLEDKNVDAVIVIFVAPIITNPTQVALKISEVARKFDKPVLGCFMGVKGVATGVEELHRHQIPAYPFPESAARTLGAMVEYSGWLKTKMGTFPEFDVEKDRVREVIVKAKAERKEYLDVTEISEMFDIYGIPFTRSKICKNLEAILTEAGKIGFPLALKVASEKVLHKSEFGGVKLNLRSADDLKRAYDEIMRSLGSKGVAPESVAFLLQEMVQGGREVIMGVNAVPNFGSLLMFGMGGIYVEVLRDVSLRILPVTDLDVAQMIEEIKGYAILKGIRGEKSVAIDFLQEVLLRLGQLALDFPEISEIDLNPFMAFPEQEKCKAVDARVRIL